MIRLMSLAWSSKNTDVLTTPYNDFKVLRTCLLVSLHADVVFHNG